MQTDPNDVGGLFHPDALSRFTLTLGGLGPEEVRKAKVLYLRNAIASYRAFLETQSNFGCIQIPFWIIPLFWPFLYVQRRQLATARRLMRTQIENALDVWRDDLRGERFDLP